VILNISLPHYKAVESKGIKYVLYMIYLCNWMMYVKKIPANERKANLPKQHRAHPNISHNAFK